MFHVLLLASQIIWMDSGASDSSENEALLFYMKP